MFFVFFHNSFFFKFHFFRHTTTGVTFAYNGQKPLLKDVDFGVDMSSRGDNSCYVLSINYNYKYNQLIIIISIIS